VKLGRTGVLVSRRAPWARSPEAAKAAEDLGFGTLWVTGGIEPGVLSDVEPMLAATTRITVATGVLNIWADAPEAVARRRQELEDRYPGRLLLGLGVSHAPTVQRKGYGTYQRPLRRMAEYLDALDAAPAPVPADRRILGALGPKMLALAAARALGSDPYLVTPTHTAKARAASGAALLAPHQAVVLDRDIDRGRRTARDFLSYYLMLPNYTNNFLRAGFTADDVAGGGSDRLVDALIAVGGPHEVAQRVDAHIGAGADHVSVNVLAADLADLIGAWTRLADALR
jgi:probable F420-dependent oxidoreductase